MKAMNLMVFILYFSCCVHWQMGSVWAESEESATDEISTKISRLELPDEVRDFCGQEVSHHIEYVLRSLKEITGKQRADIKTPTKSTNLELSMEAKNVMVSQISVLMEALAHPPKDIIDEGQRTIYVNEFFDAWADDIIYLGHEYDREIKGGADDSSLPYIDLFRPYRPGFSSKSGLDGYRAGQKLASRWRSDLMDEGENKSRMSRTNIPYGKSRGHVWRSKEQIIQEHPHVAAIIFMAKLLEDSGIPPKVVVSVVPQSGSRGAKEGGTSRPILRHLIRR